MSAPKVLQTTKLTFATHETSVDKVDAVSNQRMLILDDAGLRSLICMEGEDCNDDVPKLDCQIQD